jgi:DNA-binding NarL/FixJ family response regulator
VRDAEAAIRVLVVDDHPLVRRSLTEMFDDEADFTVVGECEDGSQVVEAATRCHPDVVCMDMSMPVMNGLEATKALRAIDADVRVLVLTADPGAREKSAAAGAQALVPKSARSDALLQCLRTLAAGDGSCPYCL